MKAFKYILGLSLLLSLQSCFQDMDRPGFDYPKGKPDPSMEDYNSQKLKLDFNTGKFIDESTYQFTVSPKGVASIIPDGGLTEYAYQGGDESYMLITPHIAIKDEMLDALSSMQSLSFTAWLNSPKNDGATGLISLPNTKSFWGNFEVFFDNNGSQTEALMKVHLWKKKESGLEDVWTELRLPDFFNSGWQHLAITYDHTTSSLAVWHNGAKVHEVVFEGLGALYLEDLGEAFVIGANQFQTIPSLTSGASIQDWASYYKGLFDGINLYDRALTADEITNLFTNKL